MVDQVGQPRALGRGFSRSDGSVSDGDASVGGRRRSTQELLATVLSSQRQAGERMQQEAWLESQRAAAASVEVQPLTESPAPAPAPPPMEQSCSTRGMRDYSREAAWSEATGGDEFNPPPPPGAPPPCAAPQPEEEEEWAAAPVPQPPPPPPPPFPLVTDLSEAEERQSEEIRRYRAAAAPSPTPSPAPSPSPSPEGSFFTQGAAGSTTALHPAAPHPSVDRSSLPSHPSLLEMAAEYESLREERKRLQYEREQWQREKEEQEAQLRHERWLTRMELEEKGRAKPEEEVPNKEVVVSQSELLKWKEETVNEMKRVQQRFENTREELQALRRAKSGPNPNSSPHRSPTPPALYGGAPLPQKPLSAPLPHPHPRQTSTSASSATSASSPSSKKVFVVDLHEAPSVTTSGSAASATSRAGSSSGGRGASTTPSIDSIPAPTRTVIGSVQPPRAPTPSSPSYVGLHSRSSSRSRSRAVTDKETPSLPAPQQQQQQQPPAARRTTRSSSGSSRSTATPRFEALYQHSQEIDARRRASARRQQEEERSECTFTPNIGRRRRRPSRSGRSGSSTATASALTTEQQREQDELSSECTFRPKIGTYDARKSRHPLVQPHDIPGYQQAVRRVKDARNDRQALADQTNKKWTGDPTVPRPFEFLLDKRKAKVAPAVYIDVTIGSSGQVSGRIGVHEGDDPIRLVDSFARVYTLDPHQRERLYRTVHSTMLQHIPSYKKACEEMAPPIP